MKNFKKGMLIFLIMMITISLLGCATQNEEASSKEKVARVNKSLSMNLALEPGVVAGQVFLKNDIATARIVVKDELDEKKVQQIANKYIEILRDHYEGKSISVQGVQNNKNIVDLFIEE